MKKTLVYNFIGSKIRENYKLFNEYKSEMFNSYRNSCIYEGEEMDEWFCDTILNPENKELFDFEGVEIFLGFLSNKGKLEDFLNVNCFGDFLGKNNIDVDFFFVENKSIYEDDKVRILIK